MFVKPFQALEASLSVPRALMERGRYALEEQLGEFERGFEFEKLIALDVGFEHGVALAYEEALVCRDRVLAEAGHGLRRASTRARRKVVIEVGHARQLDVLLADHLARRSRRDAGAHACYDRIVSG